MLEMKSRMPGKKNSVDGFIRRLDTGEEKSVHLKTCQEKWSKLKQKEKKEWKNESEHLSSMGPHQMV